MCLQSSCLRVSCRIVRCLRFASSVQLLGVLRDYGDWHGLSVWSWQSRLPHVIDRTVADLALKQARVCSKALSLFTTLRFDEIVVLTKGWEARLATVSGDRIPVDCSWHRSWTSWHCSDGRWLIVISAAIILFYEFRVKIDASKLSSLLLFSPLDPTLWPS